MFSQFSIFHRLCQTIVLEESCRILSSFPNVLFGNELLHALKASLEQINVYSQMVVFILDVMFVLLLTLVSITNAN